MQARMAVDVQSRLRRDSRAAENMRSRHARGWSGQRGAKDGGVYTNVPVSNGDYDVRRGRSLPGGARAGKWRPPRQGKCLRHDSNVELSVVVRQLQSLNEDEYQDYFELEDGSDDGVEMKTLKQCCA